MNKIHVNFISLHQNAKLPTKAHDNDTGYDLYSVQDVLIPSKNSANVETGIQIGYIEQGYWFQIMPRSGLGFKNSIQPHLGVIDEGYRGLLGVKLYNFSDKDYVVKSGDRIAQLIFYPRVDANIAWSTSVIESARGETGFGNSGR